MYKFNAIDSSHLIGLYSLLVGRGSFPTQPALFCYIFLVFQFPYLICREKTTLMLVPGALFLGIGLLVGICATGDHLLTLPLVNQSLWIRACIDSTTHGLVAVVSWAIISGSTSSGHAIMQSLLCGAIASAIDLDHFWLAGSFTLKVGNLH